MGSQGPGEPVGSLLQQQAREEAQQARGEPPALSSGSSLVAPDDATASCSRFRPPRLRARDPLCARYGQTTVRGALEQDWGPEAQPPGRSPRSFVGGPLTVLATWHGVVDAVRAASTALLVRDESDASIA